MYSNFNDISNIYKILEKLTDHSLTFQELINISMGSGTFSDMLSSVTFFEFLQKYDELSTQNLRCLFDNITTTQELTAFNFNSFLFNKPLESKAVQLEEYLKKYESIRDNNGDDHILMLLNFDHEKAFDSLMRRRILSIRDLRVLIEYLKKDAIAIHFIRYNRKIFSRLLKNFIFTAQDILVLDYQLRKAAPTAASSSHFTKHKLFLFKLLEALFTQNLNEKNFAYLNNLKKIYVYMKQFIHLVHFRHRVEENFLDL